ncbi:MAG: YggS family pyridoxal phosphate-dependent enzyme, partial [Chloroflexi bacterium]|nr:YggS family pyridoxal phosphate-dependent enzyme [Chloroflexota bacterium]
MDRATLQANIARVRERIDRAAARVGRAPDTVALVAVTKTHPASTVQMAYDLGLRRFGENRLEEAAPKAQQLPRDIQWHGIGHVQSRKAALAVQLCALLHSVDSVRLACRLQRLCAEAERDLPILLEVNVSGEASKYGLRPDEVEAAVPDIQACGRLQIAGLMTIAPMAPTPEEARP